MITRPVYYYDAILLDLNMPIMAGFEASDMIDAYFYGPDSPDANVYRALIYALSAEVMTDALFQKL